MTTEILRTLEIFFKKSTIFKYGFKFNSAYKRSTGIVYFVSEDLKIVKVKIPLSYKNKNYKGTLYGGAMYSATDPIYMIQLISILGPQYVVWDKAASIKFKKPGNQTLFAEFNITDELLRQIKDEISKHQEKDFILHVNLTDPDGNIYAEVQKVIYIANKDYYRSKKKVVL